MELRTFRAATMHEALAMVRRELGPDAAVLHTREVRNRWLGLLPGPRQIEVTASRGVNVPSRLPRTRAAENQPAGAARAARRPAVREETKVHSSGARSAQHVAGHGQGPLPAVEGRRPRRLARGTVPPVHRLARRRIERGDAPANWSRASATIPAPRAFPTRCG